jgi:uncharacterized membrane protein
MDFVFMYSVFFKQMFKIGFITNWIITLQILSLCLSQVNMEFCIKLDAK